MAGEREDEEITMTRRSDSGFSLIELIVSMTIMLVVTGAIFWLVDPGQSIARAQPEAADVQQRLRVAADLLEKDLIMAGAGTYSGSIAGSLANFFPPILPRRMGATMNDPSMSFFSDRITISYVPNTAAQTNVRDPMPQPSSEIKVDPQPGCPVNDQLCGFKEGMRCIIFDDTGAFDFFTITEVQTDSLHLQHRPPNPDFSKAYTPTEHSRIAMVETHIYYLDAAQVQLRHNDGWLSDLAVTDNTVTLEFRYYGDPNPPLMPRPLVGGSNCILDAAGNPKLPTLPSGGQSLIELTPAMLTDGPVCGLAPNQFDADLYRVKKVAVRLRMQAGPAELRGRNTAGWTLFQNPGRSSSVYRNVPDFEMSYEVAPRNLNLAR
jgi:prepilin-type N-terminal cleavage/methylation domain-containing protein